MKFLTRITTLGTLLCFSQFIHAESYSERLYPRDLDGNTATIEAFYDVVSQVTWLRDTNIGLSETFGIERGYLRHGEERVDVDGDIAYSGIASYLDAMNQNAFLGYSGWRLPNVVVADDDPCLIRQTEFIGCSDREVGLLNDYLVRKYGDIESSPFYNTDDRHRWVNSNLASEGVTFRYFFDGLDGEGILGFCLGGCRSYTGAHIWPVHDGDIGTPVVPQCIDSDGDGWGWNGFESCSSGVGPVANDCIDTPPANDGWGWDGVKSCRIDIESPVCVDSHPVGDGWGWDGTKSCVIETPVTASWGPWWDRDDPTATGDWEHIFPYKACENPIEVRAKIVGTDSPVFFEDTNNAPDILNWYAGGIACKNNEQSDGYCADYAVSFKCPL